MSIPLAHQIKLEKIAADAQLKAMELIKSGQLTKNPKIFDQWFSSDDFAYISQYARECATQQEKHEEQAISINAASYWSENAKAWKVVADFAEICASAL